MQAHSLMQRMPYRTGGAWSIRGERKANYLEEKKIMKLGLAQEQEWRLGILAYELGLTGYAPKSFCFS